MVLRSRISASFIIPHEAVPVEGSYTERARDEKRFWDDAEVCSMRESGLEPCGGSSCDAPVVGDVGAAPGPEGEWEFRS